MKQRAVEANPYTQRVRRLALLRRGVGVALLAGAAAVAGMYWARRREAAPAPKVAVLGLKIEQSAAGVTISKDENGRRVFRVHADRVDQMRANGEEALHHVRIEVYDREGRASNEITGEEFGYDPATYELRAEGAVQIELEAGGALEVHAADLAYNVHTGLGSIAGGLTFAYLNAQGRARTAQLDGHEGRLGLRGVEVAWKRPGASDLELTSPEAELEKAAAEAGGDALTITLGGGARVEDGAQALAADQLVFHFRGNQTLRAMEASGHVAAADHNPARPMEARAERAAAEFAPAGTHRAALTGLRLEGGAELEQTQAARKSRLTAQEVDFGFSTSHRLKAVAARGGARLEVGGAGGAAQSLAAPELDFAFAPGAESGQPRLTEVNAKGRTQATLTGAGAGDAGTPVEAEADAMEVKLDAGQRPETAAASGNVQVRQEVAGEQRTSQSDRLRLRFAPGTGGRAELTAAIEEGHVTLRQGERELRADEAVYEPGTRTAVLTAERGSGYSQGEVRGSEAGTRFAAPRVRWVAGANGGGVLTATGGVSLSREGGVGAGALPGSNAALVVTAQQLTWTEPPGTAGGGEGSGALPGSGGKALPGTAVFEGNVRVVQAPNMLAAERVEVEGAAGRLEAAGQVVTSFVAPAGAEAGGASGAAEAAGLGAGAGKARGLTGAGARAVTIRAARLSYDQKTQEAVYTGGVKLEAEGAEIQAPEIEAWFAAGGGGRLERAVASGGVDIAAQGRRARAKEARYALAEGQVELRGGPPSIFDAEQGQISGDPLTFWLASDEIQVGSPTGARAEGRTIVHK